MQLELELLAPAKDSAIGIAAIDCGADAVYIAGPEFGARVAAGNSVQDIASLCRYAHIFNAKVYVVVNTLIKDDEIPRVKQLLDDLYHAGTDAFIIQDLNLLKLDLPPVELFASTQTVLRTPQRAKELEALGFTRLILERQLSHDQIRAIRQAVSCDLEFFVHGALCVGYSGQCYLSQHLTGRSANRGCCAQACRSRYDLVDADGRTIAKNQTLLSLKDLRLDNHIDELIADGISSFKIEGRLKNASYVKNIVRHYSLILDKFISIHPQYHRASSGKVNGGFTPNPDITFNRGYTEAFVEGKRGHWNSDDSAKALGEYVGQIAAVRGNSITIKDGPAISNGDGLSFVGKGGEITGMRAQTVNGDIVTVADASALQTGIKVYRSLNTRFERELEKNMPRRSVEVKVNHICHDGISIFKAKTEDGLTVSISYEETAPAAEKPEMAMEGLRRQMSKNSGPFNFTLESIDCDYPRFYPASSINMIRRQLAERLLEETAKRARRITVHKRLEGELANISTLETQKELLRTKYCIKWELGLCTKLKPAKYPREPLHLVNQNNSLALQFDCKNCEMVVTL